MEIRAYLNFIQRRWKIILPLFLMTLAVTTYLTLNIQPVYEASATYIVRISSASDEKNSISALNTLISSDDIPATYAKVANSRLIKRQAADQLGLSSSQRSDLTSNSQLVAGTNIIEVTAKGSDPVLVMDYANEIGEQMLQFAATLYGTYELISLDDATQPRRPVSPDIFTNLLLGALLGLSLGIGMALITEYWQASMKPATQTSSSVFPQPALIGNDPFEKEVEKALSLCAISGNPVSIAMLELDLPEKILRNNTQKEEGLSTIANMILSGLQSHDRVTIYDDSIFAFFFPDTSENLAKSKINESINRLEKLSSTEDSLGHFEIRGTTGIASFPAKDEPESMTAQEIVELAKNRMKPNSPKETGRRRSKQVSLSTTT